MGLRGHSTTSPRCARRATLAAAAAGVAVLLAAPTAGATTTALRADERAARSCTEGERRDAAVATVTVDSPGVAFVSARLPGAGADWDLAVYDASGRLVAGSAYGSGDELAQGFALAPGSLLVQACRVAGGDPTTSVEVTTRELTEPAPRMQLVRVATPTEDSVARLTELGIDLTEHGGPGFVDAVLHGPDDGALLESARFEYQVLVPDLLERSLAERGAESRVAARGAAGGLPSGRTGTYRRLFDYSEEMRALAKKHKKLVRYFTLPVETLDGRQVEAIEVAPKVRRKDGRPVFLMMGAHHAREWPSAEHTLEFAYQLIRGWKAKNKRIRGLLRRSRVIFVPVVNPDGFNVSREAGVGVADSGRDAPGGEETANLVIPYEYHRKNCRVVSPEPQDEANCTGAPNLGLTQFGVDPNRNYGGFWGGPGASAEDTQPFGATAQDYRGPGPFSEAETRNVRKLVSRRQVVTLITNHTFSNLVLRPPGLQSQGPPPDEKVYKRLGDAMAAENGYTSQRSYQLYDTSGTTEDWTYYATGGLGFTFEIGPTAFHPSYDSMVAEYGGTTESAGDGGGNRAAYMTALRNTAKPKRHAVLEGRAPRRSHLTLRKRFKTPTSPVTDGSGAEGDVIRFKDVLKTSMRVRRSGNFEWHINPSTRPLVDPRRNVPQPRPGQPSDPVAFSGTAATTVPCADFDTEDPTCWNDHGFTVPGGDGIDNGKATVRIDWTEPLSDWDLKVFRDSDGDGSSEGETRLMGSSGSAPTTSEETTLSRPGLKPGKYVARVINYAAASPYEGSVTFAKTERGIRLRREAWVLTCRRKPGGAVLDRRRVFVKRGGRVALDLRAACSA